LRVCQEVYGFVNDILFCYNIFLIVKSSHFVFFSINHEKIQSNVERTNIIYGGKNPSVRNVYSVHGELDPWRPPGVQEDINVHSPTTICPSKLSKKFLE
jgi:hypothetical protein